MAPARARNGRTTVVDAPEAPTSEDVQLPTETAPEAPTSEDVPVPATDDDEPSAEDVARSAVLAAVTAHGTEDGPGRLETATAALQHLEPADRGLVIAETAVATMVDHPDGARAVVAHLLGAARAMGPAVPIFDPIPSLVRTRARWHLLQHAASLATESQARDELALTPWQARRLERETRVELERLASSPRWSSLAGALVDATADLYPATSPAKARGRRARRADVGPVRERKGRNNTPAAWERAVGAVVRFKTTVATMGEGGTVTIGEDTFPNASKAAEHVAGYPVNARTSWKLAEPFGDHAAGTPIGDVVRAG